MKRLWLSTIALVTFTATTALEARSQVLPDQLRSAGVTAAEWQQVQTQVQRLAASRGVSERALGAIAQHIGLDVTSGGRPNLTTILEELDNKAEQLQALQTRLRLLESTQDPTTSGLLQQARAHIDAGDLDAAEAVLREARTSARRAREDAQLREAEIVATEASVLNLRSDFRGAATLYAEAADLVPEDNTPLRWRYQTDRANAVRSYGMTHVDVAAIREAAALYQDVVEPLAPRQERLADWAHTRGQYAWTLQSIGRRSESRYLDEAVTIYRDTLTYVSRESEAALQWANVQEGLCSVLVEIGQRGDEAAARDAVVCYDLVLTYFTEETNFDRWIAVRNNQGVAFRNLALRGDLDSAHRAIAIYEHALSRTTREQNPARWANLQSSLVTALTMLPDTDYAQSADRLNELLAASPRERDPYFWAMLKSNLCLVQSQLATVGMAEPNLPMVRESIASCRAALTVITRDDAPRDWARVSQNLGLSLSEFDDAQSRAEAVMLLREAAVVMDQVGDVAGAAMARVALASRLVDSDETLHAEGMAMLRAEGTEAHRARSPESWANAHYNLALELDESEQPAELREALASYAQSNTHFTRANFPGRWARTRSLMGDIHLRLNEYEQALAAYEDYQQVRTVADNAASWWRNVVAIANARYEIGKRRGDTALILSAIADYRRAAQTFESEPERYATVQHNLGNALHFLDDTEFPESETESIAAYREALRYRTRENNPTDWGDTMTGLGDALAAEVRRRGSTDITEALRAFDEVASVLTREAYPSQWARLQHNRGFALAGTRDQPSLEAAIIAYRAALEVYTAETDRESYITTHRNLGAALDELGHARQDIELLTLGMASRRSARDAVSRETSPGYWQSLHAELTEASKNYAFTVNTIEVWTEVIGNALILLETTGSSNSPAQLGIANTLLATAYFQRAELGSRDDYAAAASAYIEASTAYETAGRTQDWLDSQNQICWTQSHAAEHARNRRNARAALESGRAACERGLASIGVESAPESWAYMTDSLARVYEIEGDILRERAKLERALALYQSALPVFQQIGDTENFRATTENVARVRAKLLR